MKYVKAFFAWLIATLVIAVILGGLTTTVLSDLITRISIDRATVKQIDTMVSLVAAIGAGIWVKRLLSRGTFGD